VGNVLDIQTGDVLCTFPMKYDPPPASILPSIIGLAGGAVRLRLDGYGAVFGKARCEVLFANRPGGLLVLDPSAVEYNATAPPQNTSGFVPVALHCASSAGKSGGLVRRDLGVLLEYVDPFRAEAYSGDALCTLFIPCTVLVRLTSPPRGAALRASVPGAAFVAGGSPSSPSVEVPVP
jgi:hypothetical protein